MNRETGRLSPEERVWLRSRPVREKYQTEDEFINALFRWSARCPNQELDQEEPEEKLHA